MGGARLGRVAVMVGPEHLSGVDVMVGVVGAVDEDVVEVGDDVVVWCGRRSCDGVVPGKRCRNRSGASHHGSGGSGGGGHAAWGRAEDQRLPTDTNATLASMTVGVRGGCGRRTKKCLTLQGWLS